MKELSFRDESDKIGSVVYVDTNQVLIDLEDDEKVSISNIGTIVAIQTTRTYEFTIGVIDKIKRKANEFPHSEVMEDAVQGNEFDIEVSAYTSSDTIQVSLIGTYKTVAGERRNLFKRGVDTFPQICHSCYSIRGDNLRLFMNCLNDNVGSKKELVAGHFALDDNAIAVLDGNKFFQRHAAILGSTGSGKSWCVANLIEQASKLTSPNVIVLDMHGEYKSLCEPDNGCSDYYKIAGPGDLGSVTDRHIFLPYWLLNRDEMLSMLLDRSDNNAPNQASRFTHHVRELKKQKLNELGKQKVIETFTIDSPVPFLMQDLISALMRDDTEKGVGANGRAVKGEWEGKLTRFISRLTTKVEDKRYGFMFSPREVTLEYGWLSELLWRLMGVSDKGRGIKILDFSEVPSDVLPMVTGIISRLLFDVQIWMEDSKRAPLAIVCDEAHLYLPTQEGADVVQKQALESFERVAKEGRKYGISLVVVSQRPSDVSTTILSQCNNFMVLRLSNDRDKAVIRSLLPDVLKGVLSQLPLLDVGEAVVVGDAILLPSRIKLKEPSLKPESATRNFWLEWDSGRVEKTSIDHAIESMRSQTKR